MRNIDQKVPLGFSIKMKGKNFKIKMLFIGQCRRYFFGPSFVIFEEVRRFYLAKTCQVFEWRGYRDVFYYPRKIEIFTNFLKNLVTEIDGNLIAMSSECNRTFQPNSDIFSNSQCSIILVEYNTFPGRFCWINLSNWAYNISFELNSFEGIHSKRHLSNPTIHCNYLQWLISHYPHDLLHLIIL